MRRRMGGGCVELRIVEEREGLMTASVFEDSFEEFMREHRKWEADKRG